MARVVYLDCFSGISGDMVLGACLDLGLPIGALKEALGSLGRDVADVSARRVLRCGISATKFDVRDAPGGAPHVHASPTHEHEGRAHDHAPAHGHHAPNDVGHHHDGGEAQHAHEHQEHGHHAHDHHHHDDHAGHARHHDGEAASVAHSHRSLREICALIDRSALSASARTRAVTLFRRLAEVEADIHQMSVDEVHLHEVGALDSIVDIVGAAYAFEWLAADRIVCSPLNVGGGMVEAAHGRMPVPAPATARLLAGVPIYGGSVPHELVTPTGALLATAYATDYGPIPLMTVERIGYGAGSRDLAGTPNVLRLLIGTTVERSTSERIVVLECEIDDMNPQIFGPLMDRLYAAGALDVYYIPVQMKKNRPGTLLTVLAPLDREEAITDVVFTETTTIGLRRQEADRERLARDVVAVETPLGPVRFKRAYRHGRLINAAPEFDDCAKLAAEHRCSIKDVQALAIQCYGAQHLPPDRAL